MLAWQHATRPSPANTQKKYEHRPDKQSFRVFFLINYIALLNKKFILNTTTVVLIGEQNRAYSHIKGVFLS